MTLIEAIINNEGCTTLQATEMVQEMYEQVAAGEDVADVLREYGLDENYVFELLTSTI